MPTDETARDGGLEDGDAGAGGSGIAPRSLSIAGTPHVAARYSRKPGSSHVVWRDGRAFVDPRNA